MAAATCRSSQLGPKSAYDGKETRNYRLQPQVTRDDMFQLGVHGEIKDHKIAPVRSSSALVLSSTNANRERIYIQQPPVAASGFSSQAFAPHYPHTERRTETKTCTDCHLSKENDNNAIMAQFCCGNQVVDSWFNACSAAWRSDGWRVTEWTSRKPWSALPATYAYPDWFAQHEARTACWPKALHRPARRPACSCAENISMSPKAERHARHDPPRSPTMHLAACYQSRSRRWRRRASRD